MWNKAQYCVRRKEREKEKKSKNQINKQIDDCLNSRQEEFFFRQADHVSLYRWMLFLELLIFHNIHKCSTEIWDKRLQASLRAFDFHDWNMDFSLVGHSHKNILLHKHTSSTVDMICAASNRAAMKRFEHPQWHGNKSMDKRS